MIVAVTVVEGDLGESLDTMRAEASAESREATRRQVRTFQWVGSRWRREKGEERGGCETEEWLWRLLVVCLPTHPVLAGSYFNTTMVLAAASETGRSSSPWQTLRSASWKAP